jgi:DnaJ-class molecular chaperone
MDYPNQCPVCKGTGETRALSMRLGRVRLKNCQRCQGRGFLGRHPCICNTDDGYFVWTNAGGMEVKEICAVHRNEESVARAIGRRNNPL